MYKLKMPAALKRKLVILAPVRVMWPKLLFRLNSMEMEMEMESNEHNNQM